MAEPTYDTEEEQQPAAAQDATMHPALKAFRDAIPEETGVQPWATEATTRLNDWVRQRDISNANEAAGQEYVHNIDAFKQGMTSMVTADPTAIGVALDLVPSTMHGMLANSHPAESYDETHAALTHHIQSEVAHAAVTSAANQSAPLARSILSSDRVGALLDDRQKLGLEGYITAQTMARGADRNAEMMTAQGDQQKGQAAAAHEYVNSLVSGPTGQLDFPKSWASRLIADQGVAPQDKSTLMDLYGRLQTSGEPQTSNYARVADLLRAAHDGRAGSADILGAAGNDVSMKDAAWLHGLLNSDTAVSRQERGNLVDMIGKAQRQLQGPAGENGAMGQQAFQDFMKWFVPSYQKTGAAGLSPASDGYIFAHGGINSFAPHKGMDMPPPTVLRGSTRRPLRSIFAGEG